MQLKRMPPKVIDVMWVVFSVLPSVAAMLLVSSCSREEAAPGCCGESCDMTSRTSVVNSVAKHGTALADDGRPPAAGDAQTKDYVAEIRQLASTNNLTGDIRLEDQRQAAQLFGEFKLKIISALSRRSSNSMSTKLSISK